MPPENAFEQIRRDPNAPVRLFRAVIARQNEILDEVGKLLACEEVTSATKDDREGRSMHAVWWNRILTQARAIAWNEGRISELKVRLYDVGSPKHPCCYIARAPQEVLNLHEQATSDRAGIVPLDITDMQLLDAENKPSLERLFETGVAGRVVYFGCWTFAGGD